MWRVVRTNLWLIIASLVASVVLGFILNWYLGLYFSRYTAIGYIQVQSGRTKLMGMKEAQDFLTREDLAVEQRTQAQLLGTETLFTKVLQNKQDIRNTDWFKQFVNPDNSVAIASATYDLGKHFSAAPIPDSKLIQVSMTWKNPKDCRTIVMDIVNQHLADQKILSNDNLTRQAQALNNQMARYQNQINVLKRDINTIAARLALDGQRPGALSQQEQELMLLVGEKLKAENDANEAKAALDGAQQTIASGGTPGQVEMMIDQNPIIFQLKYQLEALKVQINANISSGTQATDMQKLQANKESLENRLQELRDAERVNTQAAYLETLNAKVQSAEADLKSINTQIANIRSNLADQSKDLAEWLTKKDEEQGYEELYRQTRDQAETINTMLTQLDMNAVAWMSEPETPQFPSFPKLPYTLSVCIMLGLGLSLGISFLREIMDTSVRSPRDIARVGQMTLLGMIPDENDDPQAAGVPLPTVIYAAPTSMLAEQFRQVRTRLQHAASLDTTRSILVTSPSPGDGKSTVACNLAAGLALNGRRILLVDANFRRPELHKIFGISNEAGFGNVLTSVENFESAVRQTRVPNLDLITTGPKPANATELLESQLLIDFIERALEEYDHVIFDSGPMLVVSETVALAPRVDGVITVVRARANSRGLLQRMRDGLRQLKAEHLGVVLNGVRATGGGYYGRNIKTYYEYQNAGSAA
jgi:capsular exopolysaccharide synthesis family protein